MHDATTRRKQKSSLSAGCRFAAFLGGPILFQPKSPPKISQKFSQRRQKRRVFPEKNLRAAPTDR
jgi:hypothetical protein